VGENKSAGGGKSSPNKWGRNPLGAVFFPVPTELIDSALFSQMGGCEVRRYITLSRIANYFRTVSFSVSLEDLKNVDGISTRSAERVNKKLAKQGLVAIDPGSNPSRYTLMDPKEWKKPILRIRFFGTAARVRVEGTVEAPEWK